MVTKLFVLYDLHIFLTRSKQQVYSERYDCHPKRTDVNHVSLLSQQQIHVSSELSWLLSLLHNLTA